MELLCLPSSVGLSVCQVGTYDVKQNSIWVQKIFGFDPGANKVGQPKKWSISKFGIFELEH